VKIGSELISFYFESPVEGSLTITVPEVIIGKDQCTGDLDFSLTFNSALVLSKYDYGYCLNIALLGFGFQIWLAKNL